MLALIHLKQTNLFGFIAILSISIGFTMYWFISKNKKIKQYFFSNYAHEKASLYYVFFRKSAGCVFNAIVPACLIYSFTPFSLTEIGINAIHLNTSLKYIGIIGIIMLSVNYFVSKNSYNLNEHPEARIEHWDVKRLIIHSLASAIYLFGYEFMNRGLLLMICYHAFGFWPAIITNLSFNFLTHIHKGIAETIVSLPYSFVLCLITISTGSILTAFVTHLIFAICNDFYSIHHNPKMKFVFSKQTKK